MLYAYGSLRRAAADIHAALGIPTRKRICARDPGDFAVADTREVERTKFLLDRVPQFGRKEEMYNCNEPAINRDR